MTTPVVTVVDPHSPSAAPPAVRRPSLLTHRDRVLAGAIAGSLLLGVLAARNLRVDPEVTATVVRLAPTVDRVEGVLQLDLVLRSRLLVERPVSAVRAGGGWRLYGPGPSVTGSGALVSLVHPVQCDGDVGVPEELVVESPDGDLAVPLEQQPDVGDACDPFGPDLAVRAVSGVVIRTTEGTRVRVRLVNLASREHTVEGLSVTGFAFRSTEPLPLALPPRSRSRPALLKELAEQELVVDATVAACGPARATLDGLLQSGRPDRVPLVLARETAQIDVPGIASYLELQWRAACIR